jgi:hypothetical protein
MGLTRVGEVNAIPVEVPPVIVGLVMVGVVRISFTKICPDVAVLEATPLAILAP